MRKSNTLAGLVKARALLSQMQSKLPETSRYSNKIQEVVEILDKTISDTEHNPSVIDPKKMLEGTQLVRTVLETLSLVKDLFNSCCQQTIRYLNAHRCGKA